MLGDCNALFYGRAPLCDLWCFFSALLSPEIGAESEPMNEGERAVRLRPRCRLELICSVPRDLSCLEWNLTLVHTSPSVLLRKLCSALVRWRATFLQRKEPSMAPFSSLKPCGFPTLYQTPNKQSLGAQQIFSQHCFQFSWADSVWEQTKTINQRDRIHLLLCLTCPTSCLLLFSLIQCLSWSPLMDPRSHSQWRKVTNWQSIALKHHFEVLLLCLRIYILVYFIHFRGI